MAPSQRNNVAASCGPWTGMATDATISATTTTTTRQAASTMITYYVVQKCWFSGPIVEPPIDYRRLLPTAAAAWHVAHVSAHIYAAAAAAAKQQDTSHIPVRTLLLAPSASASSTTTTTAASSSSSYGFHAAGKLFWVRPVYATYCPATDVNKSEPNAAACWLMNPQPIPPAATATVSAASGNIDRNNNNNIIHDSSITSWAHVITTHGIIGGTGNQGGSRRGHETATGRVFVGPGAASTSAWQLQQLELLHQHQQLEQLRHPVQQQQQVQQVQIFPVGMPSSFLLPSNTTTAAAEMLTRNESSHFSSCYDWLDEWPNQLRFRGVSAAIIHKHHSNNNGLTDHRKRDSGACIMASASATHGWMASSIPQQQQQQQQQQLQKIEVDSGMTWKHNDDRNHQPPNDFATGNNAGMWISAADDMTEATTRTTMSLSFWSPKRQCRQWYQDAIKTVHRDGEHHHDHNHHSHDNHGGDSGRYRSNCVGDGSASFMEEG